MPVLPEGEWALVLWAMRPSSVPDFARRGRSKGFVTPPHVGMFRPGVSPEVALAGTLAGWLEAHEGEVKLAPPLLRDAGGLLRPVTLGRDWSLPVTEFLAA